MRSTPDTSSWQKSTTSRSLPNFLRTPDPEIYLRGTYLVLDFETSVNDGRFGAAIDPRNRLALACWRTGGVTFACWGSEFSQRDLIEAIGRVDFIVAHNAKYELGWLMRCGLDLHNVLVFDTKLAEYVLLGNLAAGDKTTGMAGVSTSLDDCCIRRGYPNKDPIVDLYFKHGVNVDDIPKRWVEDRCRQDVETTERLFLDQRKRLAESGRLGVLYTKCLLTPVLADIERRGLVLDPSRVESAYADHKERLVKLEKQMEEMTGGINCRSPDQVAEYLYDKLGFSEVTKRGGEPERTDSGKRKADAKTLAKLKASTKEQSAFLSLKSEIAKVSAALSKNLEYFKYACEHADGRIYAEYNQARTATGRLSSTGIQSAAGSVQFQNLPRAFKRLFCAGSSGNVIGEADGVQLEFRVAAWLGNDSRARSDISDPEWDAHCVTAAAMFKVDYEELRRAHKAGDKKAGAMRTAAKSETFKPLYGGSKGTPEQERWYKTFRQRYPELAKVQSGWVNEVFRTKRLTTPWGLRFYWPRSKMSNSGYVNVTPSVYNYPVQSLATAEIIPIAIVYLWHRIHEEGLADSIVLVNTVHDSIVAELGEGLKDKYRQLCTLSFTEDVVRYLKQVYNIDFDVPLGVDIKFGKHWGEDSDE